MTATPTRPPASTRTKRDGRAATRPAKPRKPRAPTVIGCTERVALPGLGIDVVDAKIDTGANTTAIHATTIRVEEEDGRRFVSFHVPVRGAPPVHCRAKLRGTKLVKNTGGKPERRYYVRTRLHVGNRSWPIDVTLANRRNMRFAIIIGRAAILHRRILVDPDGAYLQGEPVLPDDATPKGTTQ